MARLTGRRLVSVNVAGDAVALLAAVLLVPGASPLLVPAALAALASRGLYRDRPVALLDGARNVLSGVTVAAALILLAGTVLAPAATAPQAAGRAWLLACALVTAQRLGVALARRADMLGGAGVPTVVLAPTQRGQELDRVLRRLPLGGLRPVGVIGPEGMSPARAAALALEAGARHVVLAGDRPAPLARACAELGLEVSVVPDAAEAGTGLRVEHVGPLTLLRLRPQSASRPALAAKHASDRVLAGLLLLALAPVLAVIAATIRLGSPGPVLFRQRRVGRDGRTFDMIKFRTMREGATEPAASLRLPAGMGPGGVEDDVDRRTPIGALLRRTSLDELPQLVNVLRGEMSLVGPRPERPELVARFAREIDRYEDRHRLKSGMTGLSQVMGLRGRTSLDDRVAYDNHYIEQWSPWLDLSILLRTVGAVFHSAE